VCVCVCVCVRERDRELLVRKDGNVQPVSQYCAHVTVQHVFRACLAGQTYVICLMPVF
jgi:nitrite reductase/ring-hydroxylating ferredoxin subunit